MANQALLAQLTQLAGQLNALQQTIGNLQASHTTLTTRLLTWKLKIPTSPLQT
jgi:hypothetical protein